MSVIFETLQKLNRPTVETDTEESAGRTHGNVYALKTVLMSPVMVLLMALVVFGLGYGLVYGLRQVQRSARMDPAVLAAAQEPAAEPAASTVPQASVAIVPVANAAPDVPPPPDVRHLQTAAVSDASVAGEPVFAGPEISPPSAEAVVSLDRENGVGGQTEGWKPPASTSPSPPPRAGIMYSASASTGGQSRDAGFTPAAYAPVSPATDHINTGQINAEGPPRAGTAAQFSAEGAPPVGTAFTGRQPYLARPSFSDRQPLHSDSRTNDALHAMPTATRVAEAIPEDAEKAASPTVKRNPIPRYTRLVNQLQTAIITGDNAAADRLLSDLAAIKGKGHPYVVKLKAYRHLQTGNYSSAERLLGQVLAQDKGDRDAQMNMAVVEANTGRLDAARRRLGNLVERYPGDETLAAMGRQLE